MPQRTVIGQQQQAGGILIQPPHREYPTGTIHPGKEVQHRLLFPVLCRGQDSQRLMQHQVHMLLIAHRLSAEGQADPVRINFLGSIPADHAIHSNDTLSGISCRFLSGTQSHCRQQFVNPLDCHAIASKTQLLPIVALL